MPDQEEINGLRLNGTKLFRVIDLEIERLIIPAKVKTIDTYTRLNECKNLKEIIFEGTVKAFSNLINLYEEFWPSVLVTSVQCKNGIVEKPDLVIKDGKLYSFNKNLKSLVIPNEIKSIVSDSFPPSETLTEVSYEGSIAEFNNIRGLTNLWKNIPDIGVKCTDGIVNKPVLIINDGTLTCCPYQNLKNVTIPKEVKDINYNAFAICKNISEISFEGTTSDFNKIPHLPDFWKSVSVSSVKCSDGIAEKPVLLIQGDELIECVDKTVKSITIPDCVRKIKRGAFSHCSLLEDVKFPSEIRTIESACFGYCYSLKKLELPEGISEINFDIVHNCFSLTSLTLPSTLKAIKGNSSGGFKGNYLLKEFIFRGSIEDLIEIDTIEFWRFANLKGVQCSDGFFPRPDFLNFDTGLDGNNLYAESLSIPEGIEEIGSKAFYAYQNLKHVSFPSSLHTIGHSAFLECSSLEEIELPSYLKIIGACAFQDCRAITKINIPFSVNTIGDGAFQGCINLTEITYEGTKADWQKINLGSIIARWTLATAVECSDGEVPLDPPYEIEGVQKRFTCNYGYRQLRIPDEAKEINFAAFKECTTLQSLTIPDSIENIIAYSFEFASSLSEIIFEGTVEKWNNLVKNPKTFESCPVKQIKCSDGIVNRELYKIENKVLTACYDLGSPVLELPAGIEKISGDRIISSIYIKKIILPEGLKEIDNNSISDLRFLETVVLPSSLEKIGFTNFSLCQHLKEFVFNGTKEQWNKVRFDYGEDSELKHMMETKMTFLKS